MTSSKTHEASYCILINYCHAILEKALSALFYIHKLTDANDWLVSLSWTFERVMSSLPSRENSLLCSVGFLAIGGCDIPGICTFSHYYYPTHFIYMTYFVICYDQQTVDSTLFGSLACFHWTVNTHGTDSVPEA